MNMNPRDIPLYYTVVSAVGHGASSRSIAMWKQEAGARREGKRAAYSNPL
jgi:hypothetical protein